VIAKLIPEDDYIVISFLDFSIEKRLHEKYKDQMNELKETHGQIVKADKLTALGEIISGISHEISTPLMIVDNRLELLYEALYANSLEESQELAEKIKSEFDRLVKIFGGMKSIVKNQEDRFEIVDLNILLVDVVNFFNELNYRPNIALKIRSDGLHWVMANKIKLQQVLINLIKNSFDALSGQKDPKVILEINSNEKEQIESLKVIDNGKGIPEDIKSSIFDMFFTSKSVGEGTGLGLSISKKIIESFSGTIQLNKSKSGSEFEIKIPAIEHGSFTLTNKYLTGESDFEDDKVLFVSDDLELMNEIYELLADQNLIVIFSNNIHQLDYMIEFLLVDQVVKLKDCAVSDFDGELIDLVSLSREDQLKYVENKFVEGE